MKKVMFTDFKSAAAFVVVLCFNLVCFSAEYFAAPNGTASGTGSISDPWDLQTALDKQSVVGSGDTLFLRGGKYTGRFTSRLSGSAGSPVVIRPYAHEVPVLDANVILKIDPVDESSTTLTVSGADLRMLTNFNVLTVHSSSGVESIKLGSIGQDNGTSRVYVNCIRGFLDTPAVAHPLENQTYVGGLTTLRVNGNFSEVRNLIIQNSNPFRAVSVTGSLSQYRGGGMDIMGNNVKIINNVIKDNGVGIGFWKTATNSTLYGNLIFNNGWVGPDRSHGHGIYTQNLPNDGRKLIRHNLIFNNFRIGMNMYGSANAHAVNYDVEENVIANNASVASFPGNPKGLTVDYRDWGVLVGTGNPADSIYFTGNHFYNPTKITVDDQLVYLNRGQHLRAGYLVHGNGDLKIIDNTFVGGQSAFQVEDWGVLSPNDVAEVRDNLVMVFGKGAHIADADHILPQNRALRDQILANSHRSSVVSGYAWATPAQADPAPLSLEYLDNVFSKESTKAGRKNGLSKNQHTEPFIVENHNFENNEYLHYRPNTDERYFTLTDVGFYPFHLPGGALDSWLELVHNSTTNNTFEAGSTYTHEQPDFTDYKVFPNEEQQGLSYLVVYNFSGANNVSIDFSQTHLQDNDAFRVIDLQSGLPVYSGVKQVGETSFTLSSKDCGVVHPKGLEHLNYMNSLTPEFGLYAIETIDSATCHLPALFSLWRQSHSCASGNQINILDLVQKINQFCP